MPIIFSFQTLQGQLETCYERISELESEVEELKSGKTRELESEIQSLNVMLELRDDLVRNQDQKIRDVNSKLQVGSTLKKINTFCADQKLLYRRDSNTVGI